MLRFNDHVPNVVFGQTQVHEACALPLGTHEAMGLQGFNVALHVGDNPHRVQRHRIALLEQFASDGVQQMTWLNQTHSTICHRVDEINDHGLQFLARQGDALVTAQAGHALMMMTADCLPIVLGNSTNHSTSHLTDRTQSTEIANLHAGWRGLAAGIIENTVAAMHIPPTWAWLGAAISQTHFEVGAEVREAFLARYPELTFAFRDASAHKFYADLYAIAGYILAQLGVQHVWGGKACSFSQTDYYSYRRNLHSGRMATFVFIRATC